MDPSRKVATKSVKKISEDVVNPDVINAEHDLYHCVSGIQGNSESVYYQIHLSSYSLEIVNMLKWCQKWDGNLYTLFLSLMPLFNNEII